MSQKSEHLVFLVGTNPLPIWMAWLFLRMELPKHGRFVKIVTLVHTSGTAEEARRLLRKMKSVDFPNTTEVADATAESDVATGSDATVEYKIICVEAGNSEEIERRLCEHLRRSPVVDVIHLHYTGGTKAMVLAAWQACEAHAKKEDRHIEGSYLNPREGVPRLMSTERIAYASDARRNIRMDLQELAELHGLNVVRCKAQQEDQADGADDSELWDQIKEEASDERPNYTQQGRALERWAYRSLCRALVREASEGLALTAYWDVNLCREKKVGRVADFQLDVLALLGPQLLLVSCTRSKGVAAIKGKAFEAWHRARQLGGDEVRVIVLSLGSEEDAQNLESNLHDEIGADDTPLQIWGSRTAEKLEAAFGKYLRKLLR